LLGAYHWAAYGAPWKTAYGYKEAFDAPTIVELPDPAQTVAAMAGSRGILLLTPVVLVALVGCVALLRDRPPLRVPAVAALVAFGAFALLQGGMANPWGGEVVGPRYMIPALPFLAVPLCRAWRSWPWLTGLAAAVGTLVLGLGLIAVSVVPHGAQVLPQLWSNLHEFGANPTVFTMAVGPLGWAVHLALIALAVVHLQREERAAHERA
ncbi:hypothetical protein B7486_60160, partial [cyanobacterium TDX16]